jgi:hypothetical protein
VGEDFVCAMEDILQTYCLPYDEKYPVVCVDEMNKNLIEDKRDPKGMEPGQVRKEDYTYEKKGSANIFLACEPLVGKRYLNVTHQRKKEDFAQFIRYILEDLYPDANKVIMVLDNLNTHKPSSLYKAFPPQKARAFLNRLEFHYTPKHASWLNMAEIEFSVLVRQGLQENIATFDELVQQVEQWEQRRNGVGTVVHWRFTTSDARIKLSRLYPVLQETDRAAEAHVTHLA